MKSLVRPDPTAKGGPKDPYARTGAGLYARRSQLAVPCLCRKRSRNVVSGRYSRISFPAACSGSKMSLNMTPPPTVSRLSIALT